MYERLQSIAWVAVVYGLPTLHIAAIVFLAVRRKWRSCKRVLRNLLHYALCIAAGYIALLALLFGVLGCALHGGCGFQSGWLFVFLSIASGICFLLAFAEFYLCSRWSSWGCSTHVSKCRLTLPSRGRFPAYGLQAPLMSNVRRLNPPRASITGHTSSIRQKATHVP